MLIHLGIKNGDLIELKSRNNANEFYVKTLTGKKIILSFSENKDSSFVISPGTIVYSENNLSNIKDVNFNSENEIIMTGKNTAVKSSKKIIVSDGEVINSATIKNIGETPVSVYFGYALYTKDGKSIDSRNNLYNNSNTVLNVVSSEAKTRICSPGATVISGKTNRILSSRSLRP